MRVRTKVTPRRWRPLLGCWVEIETWRVVDVQGGAAALEKTIQSLKDQEPLPDWPGDRLRVTHFTENGRVLQQWNHIFDEDSGWVEVVRAETTPE